MGIQLSLFAQEITYNTSRFPGGVNVSCHGASDGWINIVVVGNGPFLYNWNTGSVSQNLSGIPAGNYTVTVTDVNGSTSSIFIDLVGPQQMLINLYPSVYEGGYNISEQGGQSGYIESQVEGGTPPYSYSWSNGSTKENNNNLSAGSYTLTVTDANNCSRQASVSLTEPGPLQITGISSPLHQGFNISCKGGKDGVINLNVNGGVAPYTYQWSNGNFEQNLSGLTAGSYWVIVRDANEAAQAAQIILTEPAELSTTISTSQYPNGKNISCYGCSNGSISVTVSGGTVPYTYLWEIQQTTPSISGLDAGWYNLRISDANNCQKEESVLLTGPEREDWTMSGNAGTNPATQFIGTTDNKDLVFRTNNQEVLRLNGNGRIKLNLIANSTDNLLSVDSLGNIRLAGKLPSSVHRPPGCTHLTQNVLPWFHSPDPANWMDVVNCGNRFGLGTDQPKERLEVKGMARFSAWDESNNYIQIGHDGGTTGNAVIYNKGIGKLLINYSNSSTEPASETSINTGAYSGDVNLGNTNNTVFIKGNPRLASITNGILKVDNSGYIQAVSAGTNDVLNGSGTFVNISTLLPLSANLWHSDGSTKIFNSPVSYRVGVGTSIPNSSLQIDDGIRKICLGKAEHVHDSLGYYNSTYIGFNLYQTPGNPNSWRAENNGSDNGAAAIVVDVAGQIDFITLPTTHPGGDVNQNFTDEVMKKSSKMRITADCKVAIGCRLEADLSSDFGLFVTRGIRTSKLKVDVPADHGWADFVFKEDYTLPSLTEVETFIIKEGRLPGMPSEATVLKDGIDVVEIQTKLLQKIEELTLYVILLEKEVNELKSTR